MDVLQAIAVASAKTALPGHGQRAVQRRRGYSGYCGSL